MPSHTQDDPASLMSTGVTRRHVYIVVTLALAIFFDSVELVMTNVLATVFSADASVTKAEVSRMLAALFIGGAIGEPVIGRLSDRFGRRPALLGAIGSYALLFGGFKQSGLGREGSLEALDLFTEIKTVYLARPVAA